MATFQEIFGPQGFDCNSVDPTEDFLVPGDYTCRITEAEVSPTKAQTGHYLKVVLEVVQEGKDKGRKLYDYINIQNPNKVAEEIAARSLSALGRATNIWKIEHPQQLLNQIVIAVVTKNDSGNSIRTYKTVSEQQSATATPSPAVVSVSAPAPAVSDYVAPVTVGPPASATPAYSPQPLRRQDAPSIIVVPPEVVQPPPPAVPPAQQATAPEVVSGVPVWQ